ncbi:DUF309 domain-containing protein [Sulfuricurvum sp.]|uniref:DUF309 domain-containing protein n=1 Tax=Sulfuricurvum sp. TaxID=2025608 RepID=UPI0025CC58C2|nr:DUF309 domain-containing protein [Sulfuricurvum sp.]
MAQKFEGITEACEDFILSIRESRYYDAHEDLEHVWYPRRFEEEDEVKLWKGFINAAVSFELISRGRWDASQKAWQTYLKYKPLLERIVTPHKELYVTIVQTIEQQRGALCPSS